MQRMFSFFMLNLSSWKNSYFGYLEANTYIKSQVEVSSDWSTHISCMMYLSECNRQSNKSKTTFENPKRKLFSLMLKAFDYLELTKFRHFKKFLWYSFWKMTWEMEKQSKTHFPLVSSLQQQAHSLKAFSLFSILSHPKKFQGLFWYFNQLESCVLFNATT